MKQNCTQLKTAGGFLLLLHLIFARVSEAQVTTTFYFTFNPQTFVIPPCAATMTIEVFAPAGSQGGSSGGNPGLGAVIRGVITGTPGVTLWVIVGGQGGVSGGGQVVNAAGYDGGAQGGVSGTSTGGGGGGASDIRLIHNNISWRIMVAGGGGGGGGNSAYGAHGGGGGAGTFCSSPYGWGGGAGLGAGTGNTNGGCAGGTAPNYASGGAGGGLSSGGGGGGQPISSSGGYGCAGTGHIGGDGGGASLTWCGGASGGINGGGGGGGGYYGGGGGMSGTGGGNGGGGGGSSFANTALFTNISHTPAVVAGNGTVIISYFPSGTSMTVSPASSTICAGSTITFNGSGVSSYTWLPVGGFTGSNSASITVTPTISTTYTLNGTNTFGCPTSSILAVTVQTSVPVISIITSTNTTCLNNPVTLTASGANSYTWTGGVTNGSPYLPAATSGYTVSGTNACGTSTAATSVAVNALPIITASVNTPTVCTGGSVILNGGGSVSGYTWSPGAPNNAAFIPPATNLYTVTGIGTNGCTNIAVVGVTVIVTPTIAPVATPAAVCPGSIVTLSAVGATGYTWNPGPNPNTATISVSPLAATIYTLIRSNGPCSSTTTLALGVSQLPIVNANVSTTQICSGAGVNLSATGANSYTWLPGFSTNANFTAFPNNSTCYTVTGSNGSCTATSSVCVTVTPSPVISITSSTNTICEGQNVTLTANGAGTLTYTWLPMNSSALTQNVSPLATAIITLAATNSFSCTSTQNQLITVNPVPNMSLTSNVPYICAGNTAVLLIANPSPMVSYSWAGTTGTSFSVNPSITTTYWASGINTITGCQNTNSIVLPVYIATFVISSPTAICIGETATLIASGGANSYTWAVNAGIVSPSIAVSPVINTIYNVTGSTGNCSVQQSYSITVRQLPNVTAGVAKNQICRFEVSTISGNGAVTYSWNTGASTPTISFTLSLTTTYTLTGTDVNGCSKTTTVTQFVATCIGIDEVNDNGDGLNVFPNPNNGTFKITSNAKITLNIVNALGQLLNTITLSGDDEKTITVSNLPNGIYFITGRANGLKVNKKIIVER